MTFDYKVAFFTLGCKVNTYDTQCYIAAFEKNGFKAVVSNDSYDVGVINTCCVTNESERKARQLIRREKNNNPSAIIAVVGCYARVKTETVKTETGADIVLKQKEPQLLVEEVLKALGQQKDNSKSICEDAFVTDFSEHTRAGVKIQDGCNMFCSYCIIPYARGRSVSYDCVKLIEQINAICKNGYNEVVLTGIHLASYNYEGTLLIDLLEMIGRQTPLKRLRIGSLEPRLITEEFIGRLLKVKCFCPHFHLSMQSGSDRILKKMNRKYTAEEYLKAVELIRKYFPEGSVTTDVIVGFPGESESDFDETVEVCTRAGFSHIHVFPFSPKSGTPAEKMEDQISNAVKHERVEALIKVGKTLEEKNCLSMVGKTAEVLFEREVSANMWEGYTRNYLPVKLVSEKNMSGKICDVVITSYDVCGILAIEK